MAAEFILSVCTSLTAAAIDRRLVGRPSFFENKKIEAKLNEIVISVVEPITAFFETEGIALVDVKRIASHAEPAIKWLTNNPQYALSRGLESEQITKDLLSSTDFEIDLGPVSDFPTAFEMLLRALVDLVVRVPPAFVDWEQASYKATFRQLEDIKSTLASVYTMMQEITSSQAMAAGAFEKIVNHRAASSALKMSIHGLRQSPVPQAVTDNLFVFPEFTEYVDEQNGKSEAEERDITATTFGTLEAFLDLVTTPEPAVIQAPAGAGKTTFSNWLSAKLLTQSTPFFPVVLPLRKTLKKTELPSLTECIEQEISKVFLDLADVKEMVSWADNGRVVVIFEGFDEVSEQDRDKVIDWIKELKSAHPNLNTLITSRPLSTSHLSDLLSSKWRNIRLQPFDTQRVTNYIANFQKHGPSIQTGAKLQNPEDLASTWRSDPTLGPLTGNPLLLSTLLVVHHMDGELPDDRSKLYDRYIDGMLGLWELNKDLAPPTLPLTKEQKKKILELIAINMISQETDAASENDVAGWIASYLKDQKLPDDVRGILDHLRERSGLLIGPGQYTFAHKSIGEFLVAQACNDGIQVDSQETTYNRSLLLEKCGTDRWMTVIFLWAGLASKADTQAFIDKLVTHDNHALAGGLLYERRKSLDRNWSRDTFWKWIRVGLEKGGALADNNLISFKFWLPPGCFSIFNGKQDRLNCPNVSTLGGGSYFRQDLIGTFFNESICDPNDWIEHALDFSESLWFEFAKYVHPNEDFINAAPQTLTIPARCYWIIYQQVMGIKQSWEGRLGRKQFEPIRLDSYDTRTVEMLVLLSLYTSIPGQAEFISSVEIQNKTSGDGVELEATFETASENHVSEYLDELVSALKDSDFLAHVAAIKINELPDSFFDLLIDESYGVHLFKGIEQKDKMQNNFESALRDTMNSTEHFDVLLPLRTRASEVLSERDRRFGK